MATYMQPGGLQHQALGSTGPYFSPRLTANKRGVMHFDQKQLCSLLSSSGAKHLPRCSHLSHLKTASCLQISPEAKVAWACLHPEQFFESRSYHLMLEIQHSTGGIILIGSLVMNSSLTIARISFHVPRVWEVFYSIHNWPLCSHRALQ